MADNCTIEKDRLIYIDPNEFAGQYKKHNSNNTDFSWNQEDLAMSVDLQVIIPRREDCGQVSYLVNSEAVVTNTGESLLGRYVSFMEGKKLLEESNSLNYLTDDYTNISYQEISQNHVTSKESLGINSIDINFDAHFFPIITIKFTDVRGYSLFMPNEYTFDETVKNDGNINHGAANSFFNALFHFPYPMFLLSIKGFYGNRITFRLAVSDFKSGFQSETGNFGVTVQFIGYIYGLYTDLPLNLVMAAPYYHNQYWKSQIANGVFRYVASDGTSGNDMLTYVEFLQKLQTMNVKPESLNKTKNVETYVLRLRKIDLLNKILDLYSKLSKENENEQKYRTLYGSKGINFIYGKELNTGFTDKFKDNTGFPRNRELITEFYTAFREFITEFGEENCVLKHNMYYKSFCKQLNLQSGKDSIRIIVDDKNNSYKEIFSFLKGDEINNIFTFSGDTNTLGGTYTIDSINDNYLEKVKNGGLENYLVKGENLTYKNFTGKEITSGVFDEIDSFKSDISDEIDKLEKSNRDLQEKVDEELLTTYQDIFGFAPTVENFYRMLFAHIDCFIDYFNGPGILNPIDEDIRSGKRTVEYLGINVNETDIPKSIANQSDGVKNTLQVYPFPAYYQKHGNKEVAVYPGDALGGINFKDIREVHAVDDILSGIKHLKEDIDFVINSKEEESGSLISTINGDIVSKLSLLYNTNPWNTLPLTQNQEGKDVEKILYFFMCQLAADKAIGTKITLDSEDGKPSYIERQVNAFLKSDAFIKYIKKDRLKNALKEYSNKYDKNLVAIPNFTKGEYNVLNFDEVKKDGIDGYRLTSNILPLIFDGKQLNNPEYFQNCNLNIPNINKIFLDFSVAEFDNENNVLSGKNEKYVKDKSIELENYEEAVKYLDGIEKIPFGDYCVSMPRSQVVTCYKERKSDRNGIISGGTKQISVVTYNKIGSWSQIAKITQIDGDYEDTLPQKIYSDNEDKTTFNNLITYYNGNTFPMSVNFVGRKQSGVKTLKDEYTAVNLFSGVKEWYKDSSKYEGYKNNDDYLPLKESRRCKNTQDENVEKYTFGTYFLATMCGNKSLSTTVNKLQGKIVKQTDGNILLLDYNSLLEPFRYVDLLYLGGMLYFYNEGKSVWEKTETGNVILYELICKDGTLGWGLYKNDGSQIKNIESKQTKVEIERETFNAINPLLIKIFTEWCENDLFGDNGMYDRLSATPNEIDEDGKINPDYMDFHGYMSENDLYDYTIVQGYRTGGICEKWLRDLCTTYRHVLFLKSKNDTSLFFFKKDICYKFLTTLSNNITVPDETTPETVETNKSETSDEQRRALYYLLKNLYDKWLCSYKTTDFKLHTVTEDLEFRKERFGKNGVNTRGNAYESEYNNFLYVDQFFHDISKSYIMDANTIAKIVKDTYKGDKNIDVYTFMAYMAEKNKLMFMALPIYNNIYNSNTIQNVFSPNTLYGENATEPKKSIGTTYVIMHTNEVSHIPGDVNGMDYYRDYPDIADIKSTNCEDLRFFNLNNNETLTDLNYNVSAFCVQYGKQNQMYFKNVDVNMDNPKVTDESIRNTLMLSDGGSQGDTNQPIAIGQNIYSIYANRSYTCTIEMLGCMNIMPMMYFQLNNIPMFRGLYMIINVKHSIVAGNMTTIFTGVKVSKYSLPNINNFVLNSNIFNKLKNNVSNRMTPRSGLEIGKLNDGVNYEVAGSYYQKQRVDDVLGEKVSGINQISELFNHMDIVNQKLTPINISNYEHIRINEGSVVNMQLLSGLAETDSGKTGYEHSIYAIFDEIEKSTIGDKPVELIITSCSEKRENNPGSVHNLGIAIDVYGNSRQKNDAQPLQLGTPNEGNPWVKGDTEMKSFAYNVDSVKRIRTWSHPIVQAFVKHGWGWGIYQNNGYDLMHFSYYCPSEATEENNKQGGVKTRYAK